MRKIVFKNNSFGQYFDVALPEKIRQKADSFIMEMQTSVNPAVGDGKPVMLREGVYSRRLSKTGRLIYGFDNNSIFIEDVFQ